MNNLQELAILIKSIAKSKNITIKEMLTNCKLSINTLSSMQAGGYFPRVEALAKIADYLDCSVDYLLGRTDVPEINRKISFINDGDFTVVQKAAFDGGEVGGKNPDISKYGKILELTDKDN